MKAEKTTRTAKKAPTNAARRPAAPVAKSADKTRGAKAGGKAKQQEPAEQPGDRAWAYAAAAACDLVVRDLEWQRSSKPRTVPRWEDAPPVAHVLVLVAREGTSVLERIHEQAQLKCPTDWQGWAAERAALFERAGVSADFRKLTDRSVIQVSPHHIDLATDPKHPMFDRRAKLPPDRGMAESIMALGEVVEVMQVTPHEDDDGITRLYSGSGSRRTQATRLANRLLLTRWYDAVRFTSDERRKQVTPPFLIRAVHAMVRLEGKARTAAAVVANQMRLSEDIIREADGVEQLLAAGYQLNELPERLGKSLRTITNLHSLNKLAPSLRDEVSEGKMPAAVAYKLAGITSKKQQLDAAKATVAYKSGAARCAAIDAYLAGGPLPELGAKVKALPSRTIQAAAERLGRASLSAEHQGLALLVQALAGDDEAMAQLPEPIRAAFVDPAKAARERKRWQEEGFDLVAQEAWSSACPEVTPQQVKRLQAAGALPEHLALAPTLELLHQDEVEDRSWGLPEDRITLGSLLTDYVIDERQVAADAGRTGRRVSTYAELESIGWEQAGFDKDAAAAWQAATRTPTRSAGISADHAATGRDAGITPEMLQLPPSANLVRTVVDDWDFEEDERLSLGLFVMEAGLQWDDVLEDAKVEGPRVATGSEAQALLEAEAAAAE
ncbi:hypothetical protein NAEX_09044 [Nannocystis exedens]|nr:hypothetical protein NAEX_09044 [Nannocystis exedens]